MLARPLPQPRQELGNKDSSLATAWALAPAASWQELGGLQNQLQQSWEWDMGGLLPWMFPKLSFAAHPAWQQRAEGRSRGLWWLLGVLPLRLF